MSTKKQAIRTNLRELSNLSVLKYASTDLHLVKFGYTEQLIESNSLAKQRYTYPIPSILWVMLVGRGKHIRSFNLNLVLIWYSVTLNYISLDNLDRDDTHVIMDLNDI